MTTHGGTGYADEAAHYDQLFADRQQALAKAKALRQEGYVVKMTKTSDPWGGGRYWFVEGKKERG